MCPNTIQVRSYARDIPSGEKKVKGIAITIAPIIPPAIMKNTSLLNEKSTLASWGFILVTISMLMFLIWHSKRYKNWLRLVPFSIWLYFSRCLYIFALTFLKLVCD